MPPLRPLGGPLEAVRGFDLAYPSRELLGPARVPPAPVIAGDDTTLGHAALNAWKSTVEALIPGVRVNLPADPRKAALAVKAGRAGATHLMSMGFPLCEWVAARVSGWFSASVSEILPWPTMGYVFALGPILETSAEGLQTVWCPPGFRYGEKSREALAFWNRARRESAPWGAFPGSPSPEVRHSYSALCREAYEENRRLEERLSSLSQQGFFIWSSTCRST